MINDEGLNTNMQQKTNAIEIDRCSAIISTPDRVSKLPTIIIVHGSGGIGSCEWEWHDLALKNNFNAIIVDHFTKKGVRDWWWHEPEFNPSFYDMANDVVNVIDHMYTNEALFEFIDFDKLAVVGFSAGGTASILLSTMVNEIKVFGSVNPCIWPYLPEFDKVKNKDSLHLYCGDLDDWCSYDKQKFFSERTGTHLHTYKNCHHGFTRPRTNPIGRNLPDTVTFRNCDFPVPYNYNMSNIVKFKVSWEKGVNVEYNAEASKQVQEHFINLVKSL